ncbi:hypothetical protein C3489_14250 [Streptomyces sp. Ru71]|uniref:hypothetical protein n=1 Tax=Streptomyces sp. Ru71 TaxID=2080746 RepID=UPI000CDD0881|nr:hypothetical protein [Streptomyces sp. Ru71]POX53957.1 hypothetical protein C3489_14250 [Streptomyces sp. Ru71]
MPSAALDAALADVETVFNGFASPGETGCERCFRPEETACLRTPYRRVPDGLLARFLFKDPLHYDDHPAVLRRLLPQAARAMADGTLDGIGWGWHGLARVDWRAWPAQQAAAVEAFVHAWCQDVLLTPAPSYPAEAVFETCGSILCGMTALLHRWPEGSTPDAHLAACARGWMEDLLVDRWPLTWWDPDDEAAAVTELRHWLSGPGAARLGARGDRDLATRAGLLALPYDERWAHPYWTSASATN